MKVAAIWRYPVKSMAGERVDSISIDSSGLAVSGVLQMATYSALTAVALTRLPPGRASVLAFSTPLWVAPLSAWWLDEQLTWRGLVGVATGLVGILVIVSPALQYGEISQLASCGLLLCAAAAWAVSIVFVRFHRFQTSALALAPWQMLVAVLLLLPLATILEGTGPRLSIRAMTALLYVGPVATAFAYWAAVEIGRVVRATTMSMALLAVPGLGLVFSAVALHESLSLSLEVGILLIGAGIWVVTNPPMASLDADECDNHE